MNILVTGGSGFIGSNLVCRLLLLGHKVYSIDNYDSFYSRELKLNNIRDYLTNSNFISIEGDIRNKDWPISLSNKNIELIIHLAAKAGVRPSIENPSEYFDVNINGTLNVLEFAKKSNIKKVIFASSSSVYGVNENVPWKESELDLKPISPYASSKLSAEKIGFTYSYLYNIQFLALRFFTVYGPGQRPDLAINKFINNIYNLKPIEIYGDGSTSRDYTYVDDIVDGIISSISYNQSQYEIFNLGNSKTVCLNDLIYQIAAIIGKEPIIANKPEQSGDVPHTWADISKSNKFLNYNPKISLAEGIEEQYKWQFKNI